MEGTSYIKKCLKIGLPCLGEQSLLILSTTISTILIGRLGDAELIISNMTTTVFNWMQAGIIGFSLALTVIISRYLEEKESARRFLINGIYIICGGAFLISLVALLFSENLVMLFYGESFANSARIYFLLNMLGVPIIAFIQSVSTGARGVGDFFSGLVSTIALNVINIVLIFTLCYCVNINDIHYHLLMAGIAGLISRAASAIILVLLTKRNPLFYKLKLTAPCLKSMKKICTVGFPIAVENFVFRGALLLQQQIMIPLGEIIQGGYQICSRVLDFVTAFTQAFQMTAVILVSQELGKKDFESARHIKKVLCRSTYVFFSCYALIIFLTAPYLVSLFTADTQSLFESGVTFTRSIAPVVFFLGTYNIYSGILRGAGDNRFITLVNNSSTLFGRVLLTYLLIKLGVSGWVALPLGFAADFITKSIICQIRIRKGRWLEITV